MNAGPDAGEIRLGRVADFRALGALYSARGASDQRLFHPFPGGRWLSPWIFLVLLAIQRFHRVLLRIVPTWVFAFVVYPGEARGTIDGFVYLRVRRRTATGYVANIGTQVGPRARGKGVGPRLIHALILEARKRGINRIETQAYAWNSASLRMGEKLGFREPDDPAVARQATPRGIVVTHIMDLDGPLSPTVPPGAVGVAQPSPAAPKASADAASVPPAPNLPAAAAAGSGVRVGRITDFRALGALYSSRGESDRKLFHPFPGGRFVAPWVFLILLFSQRFRRWLVRLRPSWVFGFVVFPGESPGTIDGYVYLRLRRRTEIGYVANIGTQVGPRARGKGVGPRMIHALIEVARTRGIHRIETGVYEKNTASIRMCEKVGFHVIDEPESERLHDEYGVEVRLALDLDDSPRPGTSPSTFASSATIAPGTTGANASPPNATPKPRTTLSWPFVASLLALCTGFALIAFVRLDLLFSNPYPPSGDVAEQLYWSHIWLGTAFPSQVTVWWVPPVYIFTVYIPFTHLFPLFTGQRLLMGVVPALLVFPTYLLLRESDISRVFSLFGAALLALAAPFSLMLTWNAGYNLFGIFCAIVFFAGLVGALRTRRLGYIVFAAAGLGLTAGAHDFTFVFILVGFAWVVLLALLLLPGRWATVRTLGLVLGIGALCAAPFALVYVTLTQQTGNVGGAVTVAALETLGQQFLPFAWGAGTVWTPLLYLDAAVSLLGVVALLATRGRKPETPVLLGILLAGATLSVAYPQVADRGLYFLPLGLYPMVAVLFQAAYVKLPLLVVGSAEPELPPSVEPTGEPAEGPSVDDVPPALVVSTPPALRSRPRLAWVKPVIAIVVMTAFLVANAQASLAVMSSAQQFYAVLEPEDVPVLNWLSHNTSGNSSVFTSSAGLEKWIWGYANRQSYAPTPLNLQATTLSYQITYLADLAAMGQTISTNPYLAVAQNSPAPIGSPLIYLTSQYDWTLLFSTAEDNVSFSVKVGGQAEQLSLADAQLASSATYVPCAGCTGQEQTFTWSGLPISIVQRTNLSGESVGLSWSATGGTITDVNLATYLTPEYFGVGGVNVPQLTNVSSVTDTFSYNGAPLTMTLGGTAAKYQQRPLSDGWTQIQFRGKSLLTISFIGLHAYGPAPAATTNSGTILSGLGVSYIVADFNDSVPGYGYLLYLRCETPGISPGYSITQVFQSGSHYVFAMKPT
ncbi:MAG: GNAT family N-acetyltransferase [Thermoplasmata archaeon]